MKRGLDGVGGTTGIHRELFVIDFTLILLKFPVPPRQVFALRKFLVLPSILFRNVAET